MTSAADDERKLYTMTRYQRIQSICVTSVQEDSIAQINCMNTEIHNIQHS
jgi:hypothetical protein